RAEDGNAPGGTGPATKRVAAAPMTAPRWRARPAGRGTAVLPEEYLWGFICGLQSFALEMPSSRRFTGRGVTRVEHDPPPSGAFRPRLRAGGAGQAVPPGRQGGLRVMQM